MSLVILFCFFITTFIFSEETKSFDGFLLQDKLYFGLSSQDKININDIKIIFDYDDEIKYFIAYYDIEVELCENEYCHFSYQSKREEYLSLEGYRCHKQKSNEKEECYYEYKNNTYNVYFNFKNKINKFKRFAQFEKGFFEKETRTEMLCYTTLCQTIYKKDIFYIDISQKEVPIDNLSLTLEYYKGFGYKDGNEEDIYSQDLLNYDEIILIKDKPRIIEGGILVWNLQSFFNLKDAGFYLSLLRILARVIYHYGIFLFYFS